MSDVHRILVVDDFQPFRAWVLSLIQSEPAWEMIDDASDGPEAVRKAEELSPDLIILDIGIPKLNGIEAARLIRKRVPDAKIIFLSQEDSQEVVLEAIRLGASGFVAKSRANAELLKAIRVVLQGKQYFSNGFHASIDPDGLPPDGESG